MSIDLFPSAQQKIRNLIQCKYCGKEFDKFHSAQKYCSKECSLRACGRLIERSIRKCEICNREFKIKNLIQKYCSYKCKSIKHNRRKLKGRYGAMQKLRNDLRTCEVCGYSLFEALETHHYSKTDGIVLCGNCHNIWHKISNSKYSNKEFLISTIQNTLINHQNNISTTAHQI